MTNQPYHQRNGLAFCEPVHVSPTTHIRVIGGEGPKYRGGIPEGTIALCGYDWLPDGSDLGSEVEVYPVRQWLAVDKDRGDHVGRLCSRPADHEFGPGCAEIFLQAAKDQARW